MAMLKKENVILRENDGGRIRELKAIGYKEVTEAQLKPKQKPAAKKGEGGKQDDSKK